LGANVLSYHLSRLLFVPIRCLGVTSSVEGIKQLAPYNHQWMSISRYGYM